MKKIPINDAVKRLKSSRSTVYKHIKTLKIETQKEGRKVCLTEKQYEEIQKSINKKTERHTHKNTLKEENEKLKTENIQLRTRAEVLEEQNNKIIFQMGKVSEKMGILEAEKMKLIEISEVAEETKKRGIFTKVFQFWKH